jgi:hypothetical protein
MAPLPRTDKDMEQTTKRNSEGYAPMTTLPAEPRVMQLPEGYHPQIAAWIYALEEARRRTMRAIAGLAPAALDWAAPDGGNTIGTVLYHLVVIEMSYLFEDILGLGWAPELSALLPYETRTEHGRLTPVVGETLERHIARLDRSRALLLTHLRGVSWQEWRRPRPVEGYVITPEWAIHHLLQHEAEHRGEIGELRRRAEQRP